MLHRKTGNENKVKQIGLNCKKGQPVWFCYEHFTNSRVSFDRWLKCEFLKYLKSNKVLIQRQDCKNPSRVSINQVFQTKQSEVQKRIKKLFEQGRARQISGLYICPSLIKKQEKR